MGTVSAAWRLALACVACCTAPAALAADGPTTRPTERPFLWIVEGAGARPSFVYGTIHLPDPRPILLPEVVQRAIGMSDAVYTEIPFDAATQMQLLPRMLRDEDDEKTLEDVLPRATYDRAKAYLARRGQDIKRFHPYRTWAFYAQLAMADAAGDMLKYPPLDLKLFNEAGAAGKQVGGLETIEEQIATFETLDEADAARVLAKALDLMERDERAGVSSGERLMRAYMAGEVAPVRALMLESYDETDPAQKKMLDALLTQRDKRLAERIIARLRAAPDKSAFFAIGAGHLVMDDNVITRLERAGLKLRRLTPADTEALARLAGAPATQPGR